MSGAAAPPQGAGRLGTLLRAERDERVSPLELFFDLVFVLAITQCTALMARDGSWRGVAQGLLVLGVMWWSWVGYAWLTSVADPEQGLVRLTILAAMAGLLVAGMAIPRAFGSSAGVFVAAYAAVRALHVVLFLLTSRGDRHLRRSVLQLAGSTGVAVGVLAGAAFADGPLQGALWAAALVLDVAGPLLGHVEGWRLEPHHFHERHGLILIIALGESIVAVGLGAQAGLTGGIVAAAILGAVVSGALWWLYFDVVAVAAGRRLSGAEPGRERNAIARDSYSLLHLPMVAGIVLVALGLKKTLAHVDAQLHDVAAVALLGGTSTYLAAHLAFRWRNVGSLNRPRLVTALACVALVPAALAMPALATLAVLAAVLSALVGYERIRYAEARARLRRTLAGGSPAS